MAADPVQLASLLVRQFEGFSEKAYKCPAGVLTIGYGRTGKDVVEGTTTTRDAEDVHLKARLDWLWKRIDHDLGRDLNANQSAALISLAYNIGLGALQRSTLWLLLQDGQVGPAADQFLRWDKAGGQTLKGLQVRRKAERDLFMSEPAK